MTRLQAPERRRQLLDAAIRCFARGEATTAQIARTAGVSEPILYRHFESKLDLFIAVVDESGARIRDTWPKPDRTATKVLLAALAEAPRERRLRNACNRQLRALRRRVDDDQAVSAWLGSALLPG